MSITKLKDLRIEKGLSQTSVATLIHRSQGSYCDMENGKTEPDIETLKILADLYNCSIDYIVGRENEDSIIVVNGENLSSIEKSMIEQFRLLDDENKLLSINLIKKLNK